MLQIKFGFYWPSGFSGEEVRIGTEIGTETSGLWPHKEGACLKEVYLHSR